MVTIHECLLNSYTDSINRLTQDLGTQVLGPGQPNAAVLDALGTAQLFAEVEVRNKELAEACRSGLYLAANDLETSHNISQDLASSSGSYWHGIMHRREPDYSNSAYWFRKVGTHPIFADLPAAIKQRLGNDAAPLGDLLTNWDPYAFNDVCEQHINGGEHEALCQDVQAVEWALLFDYCYQGATA